MTGSSLAAHDAAARTRRRLIERLGSPTGLFAALLQARSVHGGGKVILADAEGQSLTYDRLVLASEVLGARLDRMTRPGEAVGVLLPNVTGMPVTMFALNARGRVAALLNFTAGPRALASAVRTGLITTLLTSRRFIETAGLQDVVASLDGLETVPGRKLAVVYLEDVRAQISTGDKASGWLRARLGQGARGRAPDQTAVILFTSGTEGAPKGVALTGANLVANARQIMAHGADFLGPADVWVNPLPMFHSFGLTAGTLLPILNGMKTVLYPTPLHYKQIPKLIRSSGATLLVATDTFAQGYARAAEPGDLERLRYIVAGAERVKEATRVLLGKTRTVVLEGYGATECSPVIACNLPNDNRAGTVGPPLPGIETRLEPVEGITEGGRLLIRGPNVMAGYILPDHPGVLVPPAEGWHDTGDIVTLDDGFIQIRGRAKRFAKIGGEMVSLAAVEAVASTVWPDSSHVVVAVADARKGEQLILVTDRADADRATLAAEARSQGFPELWLPRAVLVVAAIPVLGSGKVDLPAAQEMVRTTRALL